MFRRQAGAQTEEGFMELSRSKRSTLLAIGLGIALASAVWAVKPKEPGAYLDHKEFFKPELYISSSHQRLEEVLSSLPNRVAWENFQRAREQAGQGRAEAFIDPRSGAAANLFGAFPLRPGRAHGNSVTLEEVGARLGRAVGRVDATPVGEVVRAFVREQRGVLAIDVDQLRAHRV